MENKNNFEKIKKEIEEIKSKNANHPIFKAICVEEHDSLRNGLSSRLKEIGNSFRGFKVEFSLAKFNNEIPGLIIKNEGADLVIIDLDQHPNDPVNTVNQIRAFGWYIPVIFASVERIKAVKALNIVKSVDIAFSGINNLSNNGSIIYNLNKFESYLSMQDMAKKSQLERMLFPILDNLIYNSVDKQVLYLSKGPRIISSAILRAKEIRMHVEEAIERYKRNKNGE
ncbi:MAG: hypothetical protein N3G74_00290 [Candidatus Micrarchaeota archaeon]|nr:hypothetical protein [Candidatus Micrarchaeota archaeon]